ncbi:MAG: universal stress protein [Bacteriovorax sp.]|nr:universal stress protein [Bacteriovorax sp.]
MKILWTFDPFDKNREMYNLGKDLLNNCFSKKDSLEVVYVASNAQAELATSFSIPVEKRYSDYPKKIIKDQLKKLSLKNIKIEVLFEKSLSLTSIVKKVVEYTKKNKTDLIVIASNGKKFLPRFVLGSFAESIVHMSACDLLIYHQKTKFKSKAPANIVYAHDFSPKGSIGLEKIIAYATKWNSTLTIVHIPVPEAGIDFQEFKEITEKRVQKVEKSLEKQKVKCNIYLEYDIRPIIETLLDVAAKTKADIIAVTAQSNKLSALLGGSITRQVLRESLLPTLILKV